ncbi:MAG TPA: hypothetical protein VN175_10080 [Rhizomicrobium sp.]|nr:hypothetical protein [Rhizomicrobium sp.]
MDIDMQSGEIAFLAVAVGAISVFGGVLAWASWMEWRAAKAKREQTQDMIASASARRAF